MLGNVLSGGEGAAEMNSTQSWSSRGLGSGRECQEVFKCCLRGMNQLLHRSTC